MLRRYYSNPALFLFSPENADIVLVKYNATVAIINLRLTIGIAVAGVLACLLFKPTVEQYLLVSNSIPSVTAKAEELQIQQDKNGNLRAAYGFLATQNGKQDYVQGNTGVSTELAQKLKNTSPVMIKYSPNNPKVSAL